MANHPIGDSRGFTLLELLFAMAIFAIGVLGVSAMADYVIKSNRQSRNLTTATTLAQNKIDDLRKVDYLAIMNGTETGLDERGKTGSGIFSRAVRVATNPTPAYKTVTVTVDWMDPVSRKVVLSTIIAE